MSWAVATVRVPVPMRVDVLLANGAKQLIVLKNLLQDDDAHQIWYPARHCCCCVRTFSVVLTSPPWDIQFSGNFRNGVFRH